MSHQCSSTSVDNITLDNHQHVSVACKLCQLTRTRIALARIVIATAASMSRSNRNFCLKPTFPMILQLIRSPIMSVHEFLPPELTTRFHEKEVEFNTKDRTYCHMGTCFASIALVPVLEAPLEVLRKRSRVQYKGPDVLPRGHLLCIHPTRSCSRCSS